MSGYPINNFLPRQYAVPVASTRYQYGAATRGACMMRFPAAAAFAPGAPFDWFAIVDNQGRSKTFEFRPDIAPPTAVSGQVPSVAGRKVIAIQGLATGTLVADQTVTAINQCSLIASQILSPNLGNGGRLGVFAAWNTAQAVDDEVLVTMLAPGPGGLLDVAELQTNVVGFAATPFIGGTGAILSGQTRAAGLIAAVGGALLVDGEAFTIRGLAADGTVDPVGVTFEFSDDGPVIAPNVTVPFAAGNTAAQVASAIVSAINDPGAPPVGPNSTPGFWRVRASIHPTFGSVVLLRYAFPGSLAGSVIDPAFITDSVASDGFLVAGMTGGQYGSAMAPLRWGLSRAAVPVAPGPDQPEQG